MLSNVPAWKRLGLKLKSTPRSQSEKPAIPNSSSDVAPQESPNSSGAVNAVKRKSSGAPLDRSAKKVRKEDGGSKKPKKTVSFAAEPSDLSSSGTGATNGTHVTSTKKKVKAQPSNKKPAKPLQQKNSDVNLQPALEYLRKWKTSRDDWKFNKNHQAKLLDTLFADGTTIPAVDINSFYEYIADLKGFSRARLRETAKGIQKADMEKGSGGFPDASKEVAQRKQKEYEEIIAGFLREGRTPEKRRFEEVDYVLRTADMEMQRRVVKRMRAEVVMDELEDSDDTSTTTTTTSTTTTTKSQPTQGSSQTTAREAEADQGVKMDDGSQRRKRRRKMRVDVQDNESSSSSESESEEESSSSDTSSDSSDEDTEMVTNPQIEVETSSSSSSSSSESELDSEEASDDEDDGDN